MTTVLAIEPGYEGASAVVIDHSTTVRGRSGIEVPSLLALPGGGIAQDPHTVLALVVKAGREAATQADTDIDVVALATPAEAVLAWDLDSGGRPLSSLVVRAAREAEPLCDTLRPHRNRVAERTGLALDPRHAGLKLAWLRNTLTGDGVATTLDSWLIHQLTGEFVTDAATAAVEVRPSDRAALLGATALARLATDPTLSSADAVVNDDAERIHTSRWTPDHAGDFLERWSMLARSA